MVTHQIFCTKIIAAFLHFNQMLFHHVLKNFAKYVDHMFQHEQVDSILSHICLPQEGQEMAGLRLAIRRNLEQSDTWQACTKELKNIFCRSFTHKFRMVIASSYVVVIIVPKTNMHVHLTILWCFVEIFIKQNYNTFHIALTFVKKSFEIMGKNKTDNIVTFSFSTGKVLYYFAVKKHFTEKINFVENGERVIW